VSATSADDSLARLLAEPALEVAPRLLGSVFWSGRVGVRLTEVEAYHGQGQDPGSHAHRGRSARNGSMFEGGGTLYVYLSYGIHRCVNIVCGPEGYASGVLLRAGEVVAGEDEASELPVVDMARLLDPELSAQETAKLGSAFREWGFFQVRTMDFRFPPLSYFSSLLAYCFAA